MCASTNPRAQSRLDRVFAKLKDWEAEEVELVGTKPIVTEDGKELTRRVQTGQTWQDVFVWPSDHFGLLATFVKKRS